MEIKLSFFDNILQKINVKKSYFSPVKSRKNNILDEKKYIFPADRKKSNLKDSRYDYIKKHISESSKFAYLLSFIGFICAYITFLLVTKKFNDFNFSIYSYDVILSSSILFSSMIFLLFSLIYGIKSVREEGVNKFFAYISLFIPAALLFVIFVFLII